MKNQLKYLQEFRSVLSDYQISDKSRDILNKTKLVLLAATTSSGRNTIIRELVKTGEYHYIVSDTTRQPRINDGIPEQHGVEYWFRAEEEMLEDLRNGEYLEAAVIHDQQVSGISIRELQQAQIEGKIAVSDIEIVGAHTITRLKPDTHAIFVLPPDFEEWQRRLKHRGDMDEHEYERRMMSAAEELRTALEQSYYTFVVNDTVPHAIKQIHDAVTHGEANSKEQAVNSALAQKLYEQTQDFLDKRKQG